MLSYSGPTDDIEPAPPYEPPNRFSFNGSGSGANIHGTHPAPENFIFNTASYPELPGFYDHYAHDQMKMMELNSKQKAKMKRQLHHNDSSEVTTVRTRSSGSKCALIFFVILSIFIVGGFVALVAYMVSSRL